MRRLLALSMLLLAGLLAACDLSNLPAAPTPTATLEPPATATLEPTLEPTTEPTLAPTSTSVAQAPATATVSGAPTSAAANPSGTPSLDIAEAQRQLDQIEQETTQIRGLDPKSDVKAEFIPSDQMKTNLAAEINTEYPVDEARRDATSLWLLRLIDDPTIDLHKLQIDLLGEQVLGYYDPKKKELFVLSNQPSLSALSRMTLAHEYTHSLQDQYYDLQKVRPDHVDNDRGTAATALIEGDAVVSQLGYARSFMTPNDIQSYISETSQMSTSVTDNAPRYIRDSLTFPYEQGPTFIGALAATKPGSFAAVNDALADPPTSTEQVLHPEKYTNSPRDEPVKVTVPPLTSTLGAGWTYQEGDTLGEFDFRIMLAENGVDGPPTTATPDPGVTLPGERAAAGWGGAEYAYYQNAGAKTDLLAMVTRWDTEKDATEFNDAMTTSFSSLKKDGTLWTDGKRYFALDNSGDTVVYAAGTDRAAVERVLPALK